MECLADYKTCMGQLIPPYVVNDYFDLFILILMKIVKLRQTTPSRVILFDLTGVLYITLFSIIFAKTKIGSFEERIKPLDD